MKTTVNAQPAREKNLGKNMNEAPKLSDQAFYLIVMSKLLKKELALKSLEKFMTPGITSEHYENAA